MMIFFICARMFNMTTGSYIVKRDGKVWIGNVEISSPVVGGCFVGDFKQDFLRRYEQIWNQKARGRSIFHESCLRKISDHRHRNLPESQGRPDTGYNLFNN